LVSLTDHPSTLVYRCSFQVLITGGGSGIGKMMALGFAQNGAHVYLAARKEKQLQEVRSDDLLTSPYTSFV